ncbi:MAG TPA: ABC transporter ATP-binding protein [Propionibacteriaceae bacterium]|nr:ABC transporter ATP-binding protein [Propionibacteriaceae bacterium]
MTSVIETSGLTKHFGSTVALDGLNLQVSQGEVHGFLGPNGAGKSTTIRILLGLLRADGGRATLLGGDPWRDIATLHRKVAYIPGDVNLWPNLTGGEVIDMLGRMRGGLDPAKRKDLLARFDLDPTKKCRAYSKGNRQKVALVAALASDADVYLLDEPTSGLDPLMETVFATCAKELRAQGGTILLSSHILSEVEALADRISIIREGRIVESGTLSEMRHLHATRVEAELAGPVPDLHRLAGVEGLHVSGQTVTFSVTADGLDGAIAMLGEGGIKALVCSPVSLEELFLAKYDEGAASRLATEDGVRASGGATA